MLDFKPESQSTDIGFAVEYLTRMMKRRCTVFVLSDFFSEKAFDQELQIANRKHDVMALQVYDQFASALPDVGLIRVKDAETMHEMYIDTSSKRLRNMYSRRWTERQRELKNVFSRSNIDSVSISTTDDYVKKMMMLFDRRA